MHTFSCHITKLPCEEITARINGKLLHYFYRTVSSKAALLHQVFHVFLNRPSAWHKIPALLYKARYRNAPQQSRRLPTSALGCDDKVNFYEAHAAKPVSKIAFCPRSPGGKAADLKEKANSGKTGLTNLET